MVSFEEFKKLRIIIGKIKEVSDHPNADKLYVLKVDTGEGEKTVVAGIKKSYSPESLKDKLVALVDNLEPAVIRGVESQGMVLAAQGAENLAIISPDKEISPGSTVK